MAPPKRIQTFRDLLVWQKAFELCLEVYRVTDVFPRHERYGLAADLRKTVRSIPYDIAEGHRRTSTLEYVRFLDIASGSATELETQFLLGRALGYTDEKLSLRLLAALSEVERMLAALMRKLREKTASPAVGSSRPSPSTPRILGS
jgi:four helix bundle protein